MTLLSEVGHRLGFHNVCGHTFYRDRKTNQSEGRQHETPAELVAGLLVMLMHWFPERKFVFAGDNAYRELGTPEMFD